MFFIDLTKGDAAKETCLSVLIQSACQPLIGKQGSEARWGELVASSRCHAAADELWMGDTVFLKFKFSPDEPTRISDVSETESVWHTDCMSYTFVHAAVPRCAARPLGHVQTLHTLWEWLHCKAAAGVWSPEEDCLTGWRAQSLMGRSTYTGTALNVSWSRMRVQEFDVKVKALWTRSADWMQNSLKRLYSLKRQGYLNNPKTPKKSKHRTRKGKRKGRRKNMDKLDDSMHPED